MVNNYDKGIDKARRIITDLESQVFTKEEYKKLMHEIKSQIELAISEAEKGVISTEFVAQFIDKIYVSIPGDNDDRCLRDGENSPPSIPIRLKIKLFTGKSSQKWLEFFNYRFKSRMGHTSNLILIHHDIRILSILKRLNNKSPNTDEEQMDYWRCSCGVVNSKYTTACECGKTRSEIMDKTAKERDEFKNLF